MLSSRTRSQSDYVSISLLIFVVCFFYIYTNLQWANNMDMDLNKDENE